jgi:hypothetical protein
MNRQAVYLIILSFVLLIGVFVFSFFFLIPKGKEYRLLRLENKKEIQQLDLTQRRYDQTYEKLKDIQSQNRHTITAFETPFNSERFSKLYKQEFQDLYLTELDTNDTNTSFKTYEVNVTSNIASPKSFYTFLDGINKSEWIIGVNFPIHFEREGELIRSSFTMKVHNHLPPQQEEKK